MVQSWLGRGVHVNGYSPANTSGAGFAPLLCVANFCERDLCITKLLLERGADACLASIKDNVGPSSPHLWHACGSNALHFAVDSLEDAGPDLIATLVASGADPSTQCGLGDTPLLRMVEKFGFYICRHKPPTRARRADAVDCVRMLARAVKDINAVDALGGTALHRLVFQNVELMFVKYASMVPCQQGIGIHIRDHKGRTAADIIQKKYRHQREDWTMEMFE